MDQPPADVNRNRALEALDWVTDADVRLRDEGAVIAGEAFVVPSGGGVTLDQLREATSAVHDVDWKMYDVVVTAAEDIGSKRDPQEGRPIR